MTRILVEGLVDVRLDPRAKEQRRDGMPGVRRVRCGRCVIAGDDHDIGEPGVVSGLGTANNLNLTIFETSIDIAAGEILRTSGTQEGMPAGLAVAQLDADARTNGGGIETDGVVPLADGRTLNVVIVIQFGGAPIVTGTESSTTTTTVGEGTDSGSTP